MIRVDVRSACRLGSSGDHQVPESSPFRYLSSFKPSLIRGRSLQRWKRCSTGNRRQIAFRNAATVQRNLCKTFHIDGGCHTGETVAVRLSSGVGKPFRPPPTGTLRVLALPAKRVLLGSGFSQSKLSFLTFPVH